MSWLQSVPVHSAVQSHCPVAASHGWLATGSASLDTLQLHDEAQFLPNVPFSHTETQSLVTEMTLLAVILIQIIMVITMLFLLTFKQFYGLFKHCLQEEQLTPFLPGVQLHVNESIPSTQSPPKAHTTPTQSSMSVENAPSVIAFTGSPGFFNIYACTHSVSSDSGQQFKIPHHIGTTV